MKMIVCVHTDSELLQWESQSERMNVEQMDNKWSIVVKLRQLFRKVNPNHTLRAHTASAMLNSNRTTANPKVMRWSEYAVWFRFTRRPMWASTNVIRLQNRTQPCSMKTYWTIMKKEVVTWRKHEDGYPMWIIRPVETIMWLLDRMKNICKSEGMCETQS